MFRQVRAHTKYIKKDAVFRSYLSFFIFPPPDRVVLERARAIFFNLFFSLSLTRFISIPSCAKLSFQWAKLFCRVCFSPLLGIIIMEFYCASFFSRAFSLSFYLSTSLFQCRRRDPVVLDCWVCCTCTVGATLTEWMAAAAPISRYQLIVDALIKQIFAFSFSAPRRSVIRLDAVGNNLLFNCIRCERTMQEQ